MRTRFVDSVANLLRADPTTLANEYRSVSQASAHEFRDEAERARYADLVHTWGLFAHAERFPVALAEAGASDPAPAAPVEPVCRECGSDSLVRDAAARWDTGSQSWSVSAVYDATFCDDCESESDTLCRWVPAGSVRADAA